MNSEKRTITVQSEKEGEEYPTLVWFKERLRLRNNPHKIELMFLSKNDTVGQELLAALKKIIESTEAMKTEQGGGMLLEEVVRKTISVEEAKGLLVKVDEYNKTRGTELSAALFNEFMNYIYVPVKLKEKNFNELVGFKKLRKAA